ncbi:hypothetical protein [Clostridium kluyveri]|uniref:Zinc ribbon domain-containing protein n=1 Tax=Clostridium kluyveri TaxID=1534 RepID=A0A1L5FAZ4_CLOKL|nr:hypothetical protein [Clostridium kluyveri]APM40172.1 hypothetical protein BS101_16200 [Clostridium kluyveri]
MSKMKLCKTCQKEIARSAKICPHCGAKNKRSKLKTFAIGAIIFIIFIAVISALDSSDTSKADLVDVVKTGYIGNYKSVSIGQVLEKSFTESTWDSFESKGKNIVEVILKDTSSGRTRTAKIQFAVEKDNTFNIVFLKTDSGTSIDPSSVSSYGMDAYATKAFLDTLYDEYGKHFDESVVGDFEDNNDTLSGTPSSKYKK